MKLPSDADSRGRNFRGRELDFISEVLKSGVLGGVKGTQVKAFERDFAAR